VLRRPGSDIFAPCYARHGRERQEIAWCIGDGGRPGREFDSGQTVSSLATRGAIPLVLLLGGCDLGPAYLRPRLEMPVEFRATSATETAAWPSEDWWRGFNSPDLDALI
jgi:hypothetical protein